MTFGLKPYSMKSPSSAEWLGEIPAHWGVKPNRALFEEIKIQGCPDEPLLSVTISKGVIRQSDMLSDTSKKDSSNLDKTKYKLVQLGEIVYNKMRAWQGAVGMSVHRGITSPAYIVQRPRPEVYSKYAHYLLRTPGFSKEAERWSYGIASDQWSLRPEDFKKIYACLPPFKEQTAIACYLDHIGHRINRYIQAKQKLIELLDEQKQAIIQEAVTGRIDVRTGQPYAAYKDSSVEWLGEVPEHWAVRKIKHWLLINQLILSEDVYPEYTFDYLDIGSIDAGHLVSPPKRVLFKNAPSRARRIVREGDTIMSTVRTYLKAVWHVEEISFDLIASTGFAVFTPELGTWPKFIKYMCQSQYFTNQITSCSVGIAYPAIPDTKLKAIETAVPHLSEQTAIACYLDEKISKIDKAITRTQRQAELLREYHQRLISDVVTGKLDVREAAAKLPPEEDDRDPANSPDKIPSHKMSHDGIEPGTSGAML